MSLDLGTLEASIAVDTTRAEKALQAFETRLGRTEQQLGKLDGGKTRVDVNPGKGLDEAQRKTEQLGKTLDGVSGKRATIGVDTGDLERGLGQATSTVERFRKQADEQAVVHPEVDEAGFDSQLDGLLGKVGKCAAAAGAAFSAFDFAKDVMAAGRDFQSEMNTLTAVSGATADQVAAVQARARELGSATDLTATSASDAAAAMTELAKGGFSVEDAMGAAKGTLQLASAAQVDAAQAATIQSQALQSFGLEASEAARVADILAGSANASSAEMTGIAQGLQQAGTVSKQFGLSIDDTATALAMFANAGIQGSDAGTLLKTALLSLTDQGKPAQQAIEELGLTIYDSQGKFVGLSSLMGQLQTAAQNMTDEQYQAATATLFGSDAMRLAGIAAQQGSEGFDTLKEAVTRQGQAAEVAAAQTEGLPGALERWENTVEDLQLGVFDAIQEELVGALNLGVDALDAAQPAIENMAQAAASAAADVLKLVNAAANAPAGFKDAALGVAEFGLVLAALKSDPVEKMFGAIRKGAASTRSVFKDAATVARESAAQYGAQAMMAKQVAAEQMALARTAETAQARANAFWAAHDAKWSAAANTVRAQTSAIGGLATAMGGTVKRGLGGVVDFLGGPWAVAFAAGVSAFTAFHNAGKAVEQANEAVAASARAAAQAQDELKLAANGTEGMLSGDALKAAETMVSGAMAEITEKGAASTKILGGVRSAIDEVGVGTVFLAAVSGEANEKYQTALDGARSLGAQHEVLAKALRETGMSQEEMNAVVAKGGPEYEQLISTLRGMGPEGEKVAQSLSQAREEIERTAQAGRELPESFVQATRAIDVLADSASSAQDKLAAMDSLMQVLGLRPKDAERAMLEFKQSIDQTAHEVEMITRSTDFMGQAMFDASGKLQLTDANQATIELQKKLDGIASSLEQAALKGADVDEAFANMEPTLQAIQQAWGLTDEQMEGIRAQLEGIRDASKFAVSLDGADQVTQDLAAILTSLKGAEEGQHFIALDMPSDDVMRALDEIGVKVTDLGNGKVQIPVTAETQDALGKLQEISSFLDDAAAKGISVTALLDTTPMELSAEQAQGILDSFEGQQVTPEADLILDKLRAGDEVARGELAALSAVTAVPSADLDPSQFAAKRDTVNADLDAVGKRKVEPTVGAKTEDAERKLGGILGKLESIASRVWIGTIRLVHNNEAGGIAGLEQGGIPALAGGGSPMYGTHGQSYILPTAGPGTDQVDGILGVDRNGQATAAVNRGEFVVNDKRTAQYEPTLWAINAGDTVGAMQSLAQMVPGMDVGNLPRLADGGVVSPAELLAFARGKNVDGKQAPGPLEGYPYTWGGGLLSNWGDCSGAMSGLAAFAVGAPLAGRKFATGNQGQVLAQMGARSGLGSGPRIAFGWFNGGPYGGHTAGTIYDENGARINVEMGGGRGNGQIGGAAAGADNSQFTDRAFIPLAGAGSLGDVESTSVNGVTVSKGAKKFTVDWGTAANLARDVEDRTHKAAALARYNAGVYDTGGVLPPGSIAINRSGHDEYVLPPAVTNAVATYLPKVAEQYPQLVAGMQEFSGWARKVAETGGSREALAEMGWQHSVEAKAGLAALPDDASDFERWALYANRTAGEALMGAATMTNSQWVEAGEKLGFTFLGEYVGGIVRAQEDIEDSYVAQVDAADALVQAQENVAKAQQQLNEVMAESPELSTQKQRQLEDAERKLQEAKDAPVAKSDTDGSAKAKKIEDAERNLARVREDAATELEKNGAKDAEATLAARESVAEAEKDLATAEQVVKASAAATGQAQIAMAIEVASTVIKVSKKAYEAIHKVLELSRAARVGTAEAQAQIMGNVRDLTLAAEQQRQTVAALQAQMISMKLAVADSAWKVRQAQDGVVQAHLEGLLGIRKAEKDAAAERERLANGTRYNFRDLSIEYDSMIRNTLIRLGDMRDAAGELADVTTADMVARIKGEKQLTKVTALQVAERLAQEKRLSTHEMMLLEATFSGRFAGLNLEKATLEEQMAFTEAYYAAQKAGIADVMEQALQTSPELLALNSLIWAAQYEREANMLGAQLQMIDATYEQQRAVVNLRRLTDDLGTEAARLAQLSGKTFGMGSEEATIKAEIARVQAENARAQADLKDFGNRVGRAFDWNGDGKTLFFNNEGSQKVQAARATLEANNAYLAELNERLKKVGGDPNTAVSAGDERLLKLAGLMMANGENERAQGLLRLTQMGRADDALRLSKLDDQLYEIERQRTEAQRRLEDARAEAQHGYDRLGIEGDKYAAEARKRAAGYDAEMFRESDGGVRDAYAELSKWSRMSALTATEMRDDVRKYMEAGGFKASQPVTVRIDLTKDANYSANEVEIMARELMEKVGAHDVEIRQLKSATNPVSAKSVQYTRAGINA